MHFWQPFVSPADTLCEKFTGGLAMRYEMRCGKYISAGLLFLLLAFCFAVAASQSDTAREAFTFVQIADPQLGKGGYEHDVRLFRKAVERINGLKPDFVIICGDFVEDFDSQSIADFKKIKSELTVPSYLTPGNHELHYQPTPETLSRYRENFGKDYFSFEHNGYTFVFTDSQLWKSPLKGETEKLDEWFKKALKAAKDENSPVFMVQHIPLYLKQPDEPEDPNYNLSIAKRKELLTLMVDFGVVAILGGHTQETVINNYKGIQLVNTGSATKNDDNSPPGFRIWRVESLNSIKHEFVPLDILALHQNAVPAPASKK
jgi:serine/threonine-protein phosphatase CPPED1